MGKNKKIIIYIIVGALLVAIATAGTIFVLSSMNKQTSTKSKTTTTKVSADNLRVKAEAARKANNKTQAKALLTQASQILSEQPKSDTNTNAQIDVAAQQCMLGVKSACKGP